MIIDSGRGTSSRPRSMDTTEGDNPPSTPHSLRSNFTTVTTDSDPTKSLGHDVLARARGGAYVDSISIMSDASGNSGFSATPSTTSHVSRIKRGSRPQVSASSKYRIEHFKIVEFCLILSSVFPVSLRV